MVDVTPPRDHLLVHRLHALVEVGAWRGGLEREARGREQWANAHWALGQEGVHGEQTFDAS